MSTVVLVISMLSLAYCQALAALLVDILGIGAGDWDERRNERVSVDVRLCSLLVLNALL